MSILSDETLRDTLSRFAISLATAAAKETLPRFRAHVAITNKLDAGFDPVTQADQEAEKSIRKLIEETYPEHGILGEEFSEKKTDSPWRWVLDPIDGTRAFICGLPTWTTLIGLEYEGYPVLGVIDQPYIGDLYIGSALGSFLHRNSEKTRLSFTETTPLNKARLTTTDPSATAYFNAVEATAFEKVSTRAKLTRYGLDGYGYAIMAGGGFDLVIEAGLQHYDAAALIPIIEGAGGIMRDWSGAEFNTAWSRPADQDGKRGQIIAASSQDLLEETLPLLADAAL